jgi:hypothetical protein
MDSMALRPWPARPAAAVTRQAIRYYTDELRWPVVLGHGLRRGGRCSCGDRTCPRPGAHPDPAHDWLLPGCGGAPVGVAARRAVAPSVLVPLGARFDVLDVPLAAALQAVTRLERMGTRSGPVLAGPDGRARFLVETGAAAAFPRLLYTTGWDDAPLDLRAHGAGAFVAMPPSRVPGGAVRWLRHPAASATTEPPQARLLLGTLAYSCHRGPGLGDRSVPGVRRLHGVQPVG